MKVEDIDQIRVNYLISLNLSERNIVKRLYYAKQTRNENEYFCLMMVRASRNFNDDE